MTKLEIKTKIRETHARKIQSINELKQLLGWKQFLKGEINKREDELYSSTPYKSLPTVQCDYNWAQHRIAFTSAMIKVRKRLIKHYQTQFSKSK